MGQAIFTKFTDTHSDLTGGEVVELVAIAVSGKTKITTNVNLARHFRQVTTPDHKLLDYCLCVITVHALRNNRHTHWSQFPYYSVIF